MDYLKGWKPSYSVVEFEGSFRPKHFFEIGLEKGEEKSAAYTYVLMHPLLLRVRLVLGLWRVRRTHRKFEKFKARHNK